jgi:hypothetical protein
MKLWVWFALLGAFAWMLYSRRQTYSGWAYGRNSAGMPSLVPPIQTLGHASNYEGMASGPPGVYYGPSSTTNQGSGGG